MPRTRPAPDRPTRAGVHPFLPIALLLGALMLALLPSSASMADEHGFSDVEHGSTHAKGIAFMREQGISTGFADGTFGPQRPVMRGQMAAFIDRALDLEVAGEPDFSDVSLSDPHGQSIANLAAAGIASGFADGTFGTYVPVTRGQMAAFIDRALELDDADDPGYPDVAIDSTHGQSIANVTAAGIARGYGDGTFGPFDQIARGQTATMFYGALTDEVRLLSTNDFHGRIGTTDDPRAAYLSTHLNTIREGHPATLHVDAGDLVGATPVLSNLFYDEPTVEVMNEIGLDVQTVGNHEFDRGQDEILRRRDGGCLEDDCAYRDDMPFEGQDFTTLSTNVIVEETGDPLTEAYHIEQVGGMDIGFIGVTTEDTPRVVHPDGIIGLDFVNEAEAVNQTIPAVQAAGADAIVVLMHEGGRQDGDKNSCDNFRGASASIHEAFDDAVDVVVDGHSHESYVCNPEGGPLVTQAYEYGQMFTDITLAFDKDDGELIFTWARNNDVTDDVEPDPAVLEIVDRYDELAGPLLEVEVGRSDVAIPRTTREAESLQGNVATDALVDQYGVDFAFQNSGGLRADLTTQGQDDDGLYPIRRADVLEVWPFGNIVTLADVDGERLEEILANGVQEVGGGRFIQVAGLRIEYSIDETAEGDFPRGVVENVEYWNHPEEEDGTDVDLSSDASYTIAMNDFMAVGGDGYPVLDPDDEIFSLSEPLEIVVEQYLVDNSPISPRIEGRIVEID